jgi:hypothetical protein
MMKRVILFNIVLLAFLSGTRAADFSEKEKSVIHTNALKVLENYNTIMNQLGLSVIKDAEKTASESQRFLELFVNRQVLIYNDLDPSHKLSEFYEAETYTNSLILWYPDGITVMLDLANVKVSEIMSHDENVYSIDLLVKKAINGNYLNQAVNRNTEELTFRIAFSMKNNSPSNFRIVGIRSSSSRFVIDNAKVMKEVNSSNLNAGDLERIHGDVRAVLADYRNFLSLLGDPGEPADDKAHYSESFSGLFQSADVKIYNDITPSAKTSLISVADYLKGYTEDYPQGIKNLALNTDSVKFGQVIKSENGGYYIYADITKFFSGSYKGKEVFREIFPLNFKIAFNAADKSFIDYKIAAIDISSVNFYEATPGAEDVKPQLTIKPVGRKGFSAYMSGSFGQSSIDDKDIKTLTIEDNAIAWTIKPGYGLRSSAGIIYYFNDNISASAGIELGRYSTKMSLSGTFTNNTTSIDGNSEVYYKMVDAAYDSVVTINYLTIPFMAGYTSGKPGKTGFYVEAGLGVSLPVKSIYLTTGDYKAYGYYPSHPTVTKYMYNNELGFFSRESINKKRSRGIEGMNLSFSASAGVTLPLGYYSSVKIGPEVIIGISDPLKAKDVYTDSYGKSYPHQPARIRSLGLRAAFTYKL